MATRDLPPRGPARDAYLKRKYGITQSDFESMLREQDHRCALCRRGVSRAAHWAVDHDHITGKVRGVLCRPCNLALGMFEDDAKLLAAAAAYLTHK